MTLATNFQDHQSSQHKKAQRYSSDQNEAQQFSLVPRRPRRLGRRTMSLREFPTGEANG